MKISLRKRPISRGARYSLILDFSPPLKHPEENKRIRFHTLGLYLYNKPKNLLQRKENRETLALAESVKSRIYSMVIEGDLSFLAGAGKTADLLQYMESEQQNKGMKTAESWRTAAKALKNYAGETIRFNDIDRAFMEGFKKHLLNRYSRNTAAHYCRISRIAINQAYREGHIKEKITDKVKGITPVKVQREYLTPAEVTALYRTPCAKSILKTAFLFSILTGLRFSDIERLKIDNIVKDDNGKAIYYRQKKTGKQQYHPIPEQAYEMIAEQLKNTDRQKAIFPNLRYTIYTPLKYLQKWAKEAGIKKHVTFHTARHTYAVQHLTNGTQMEVLRDMMGHTDMKTTQIYGQIVDELRRKAAENVRIEA